MLTQLSGASVQTRRFVILGSATLLLLLSAALIRKG